MPASLLPLPIYSTAPTPTPTSTPTPLYSTTHTHTLHTGMSGGIAYIYDPENKFPDRCNLGMVGLEQVTDPVEEALVAAYMQEHLDMTGSPVAGKLLETWPRCARHFVKVGVLLY